MAHTGLSIFVFCFLSVAAVLVVHADDCAQFSSCAECVYDATSPASVDYMNCTWCPNTMNCVMTTQNVSLQCPSAQFMGGNMNCADMTCSGAKTTTNIYFCRPGTKATLCVSVLLFIFTMAFFVWMRALHQLPWKYLDIHDAVDGYLARHNSFLLEWQLKEELNDEEADKRRHVPRGQACHICKVPQVTPPGVGEVCFWCDVSRRAYFPFFLGLSVSVLCIFLLLFVALKPWFAGWYYGIVLSCPAAYYVYFIIWVHLGRKTVIGDPRQRLSYFFQIAVVLYGRKLRQVFPDVTPLEMQESDLESEPAEEEVDDGTVGAAGAVSAMELANIRKVETNRLLRLGHIYKPFAKHILSELKNDEYILWSEEPSFNLVCFDNFWILQFFGSVVALGIWMVTTSGIADTYALQRVVSKSVLLNGGVVILLLFSLMLLMAWKGCQRYYVLTNKNLFVISSGLFGTTHGSCTPIPSVRCASIREYKTFIFGDPVATFSYETPQDPTRKMPPIRTDCFAGVHDLAALWQNFKAICGPLDSKIVKENVSHTRLVWKLHIFFHLMVIQILPIMFVHSMIAPTEVAVFGMLVFMSFPVCAVLRGVRVQTSTTTVLNVKRTVSNWRDNAGETRNFWNRLMKMKKEAGALGETVRRTLAPSAK